MHCVAATYCLAYITFVYKVVQNLLTQFKVKLFPVFTTVLLGACSDSSRFRHRAISDDHQVFSFDGTSSGWMASRKEIG